MKLNKYIISMIVTAVVTIGVLIWLFSREKSIISELEDQQAAMETADRLLVRSTELSDEQPWLAARLLLEADSLYPSANYQAAYKQLNSKKGNAWCTQRIKHDNPITAIDINPQQKRLMTGTQTGIVRVFDYTGTLLLEFDNHKASILWCKLLDNTMISVDSERIMIVRNSEGRIISKQKIHLDDKIKILLTKQKQIISVSDTVVKVWDSKGDKLLHSNQFVFDQQDEYVHYQDGLLQNEYQYSIWIKGQTDSLLASEFTVAMEQNTQGETFISGNGTTILVHGQHSFTHWDKQNTILFTVTDDINVCMWDITVDSSTVPAPLSIAEKIAFSITNIKQLEQLSETYQMEEAIDALLRKTKNETDTATLTILLNQCARLYPKINTQLQSTYHLNRYKEILLQLQQIDFTAQRKDQIYDVSNKLYQLAEPVTILIDEAWTALTEQKFAEVISKSTEALNTDPSQISAYRTLALGYLFNNEYDKAIQIYQTYKNVSVEDMPFASIFEGDLMALEVDGLTHPDADKVFKILRTKQ